MSDHFLASRWCKTELRTVLHKQITILGRRILPIQIGPLPDDCWNRFPLVFMEDIARIDMSGHNYRRGLASLLRALRKPSFQIDEDQLLMEGSELPNRANPSPAPQLLKQIALLPDCDHDGASQETISEVIREDTSNEDLSRATYNCNAKKDKEYGTRFVQDELPRIVRRAVKEGIVPAVVFIDVDNLTVINKVHGWEVGNVVLDVVSEAIRRRSFARAKYNGRCGDDTFYSVLFDSARAKEYCEKIRADIFSYQWRRTSPGLHLTCTIGYAILKVNEHPYEWLTRAILGMLEGKKEGPNTLQIGPQFSGRRFEAAAGDAEPPRGQLPTSFPKIVYQSVIPDPPVTSKPRAASNPPASSNPPVTPTPPVTFHPHLDLRDYFS